MITPDEWLLFLYLFVFLLALAIGIETEDLGPYFLILSGVAALFLASQAFLITDTVAIATLIAAMGVLIIVAAISDFVS